MKSTENECKTIEQKFSTMLALAAVGGISQESVEQLRSAAGKAIEDGQEEKRAASKKLAHALAIAHAKEAAGADERARAIIAGIPEAIRKETALREASSGDTLKTIIMTLTPLEAFRLHNANGHLMYAALLVWEYCRLAGLKPRLETRKLPRDGGTHFSTSWVILVQWTVPENKAS